MDSDLTITEALELLELPSVDCSVGQIGLHYNLLVERCGQCPTKAERNERKNVLDRAFQKLMFSNTYICAGEQSDSDGSSAWDDCDDSDSDSDEPVLVPPGFLPSLQVADNQRKFEISLKKYEVEFRQAHISADRNASVLITEEEKEKKKAEKRKQKRKKKNEKKRLVKQQQEAAMKKEDKNQKMSENEDEGQSSESEEEEDLDPNSAFVSGAAAKSLTAKAAARDSKGGKQEKSQLMPAQEKAYRYAQRGNIKASEDRYEDAIHNYTEAIRLLPNDYRFYGNRSYCYERIKNFDKALEDAQKAINMEPKQPKSYYRKGLALFGLKRLGEAEEAFNEVLRLDKDCDEAKEELFAVRLLQIKNMGFNEQAAYAAAIKYDTVHDAIDGLLNGIVSETTLDVVYVSDEEEVDNGVHMQGSLTETDLATNSSNPKGLLSLWVGNVSESVPEADLKKLFSKYGEVTSLHSLKEKSKGDKYCVFVNFKDKHSPGRAMENLQGHLLYGLRLKVKFPNSNLSLNNNVPVKATITGAGAKPINPVKPAPINGECYFWRKQGFCTQGDNCKFKHVKDHKAVDAKK